MTPYGKGKAGKYSGMTDSGYGRIAPGEGGSGDWAAPADWSASGMGMVGSQSQQTDQTPKEPTNYEMMQTMVSKLDTMNDRLGTKFQEIDHRLNGLEEQGPPAGTSDLAAIVWDLDKRVMGGRLEVFGWTQGTSSEDAKQILSDWAAAQRFASEDDLLPRHVFRVMGKNGMTDNVHLEFHSPGAAWNYVTAFNKQPPSCHGNKLRIKKATSITRAREEQPLWDAVKALNGDSNPADREYAINFRELSIIRKSDQVPVARLLNQKMVFSQEHANLQALMIQNSAQGSGKGKQKGKGKRGTKGGPAVSAPLLAPPTAASFW